MTILKIVLTLLRCSSQEVGLTSLVEGASNTRDNIPICVLKNGYILGQVNVATLRIQQHMLNVLNATRALHNNQYKLRKVLKFRENFEDQTEESQSIEEEINQQPVFLIQRLLYKAIQPSPLKPRFTIQDMQLAVLNLAQYLAAECNLEQPTSDFNNDKLLGKSLPNSETMKEVACDVVSPNSECSFKSVLSDKKKKKKKKKEGGSQLPTCPLVLQIMEMGFSKKSVENAIKSIGNCYNTNYYFIM